MSPSEPFTSLLEAASIESAALRHQPLAPEAEKKLRALLSRPLAPLGNLDKAQLASLARKSGKKGAKLDGIAAALDRIRPDWLEDYAAAAVTQLPASERGLRGVMLRQLLGKQAETGRALSLIAARLADAPQKTRPALLESVLRGIGSLDSLSTSDSSENIRTAFGEFIGAASPKTPAAFAKLGLEIVRILKVLYPSTGKELELAASRFPAPRLAPLFDEPYRSLLLRKSWGATGGDICAVLWDRLSIRLVPAAAPGVPGVPGVQRVGAYDIDCSAARIYQIEASLRSCFAGGKALADRVRSVLNAEHPALGKEFAAMAAQQRLLLQAVRNLAALRNYKTVGQADDIVEFDPRLHIPVEGEPAVGKKMRVLEPPVVRDTAGGGQEILAQGEVEEYE